VMGGDKNRYWINKAEGETLEHVVCGFSIFFEKINSKSHEFRVDMRDGSVVLFQTFADLLKVDVDVGKFDNFVNSCGFMGNVQKAKGLLETV